jgi:uncharacterized coiled-coil protein SlyX
MMWEWLTTSGFGTGALGTIAGAIGAIATARIRSKPDVQAVTNAAVAGIIQHYTTALAAQTKEVHDLRAEIAEMRETIENQSREIAELNNHILDLSKALQEHGVPPPPRRRRATSAETAK